MSASLAQRLTEYFSDGGSGADGKAPDGGDDGSNAPFELSYTEPLPLADFFAAIDDHHGRRGALLAAYSSLNDRAHEYRLVTKRLLVRRSWAAGRGERGGGGRGGGGRGGTAGGAL